MATTIAHVDSDRWTEMEMNTSMHESLAVDKTDILRIFVVGLVTIICWLRIFQPISQFDLLGFVATLIGGYPIFKEAF